MLEPSTAIGQTGPVTPMPRGQLGDGAWMREGTRTGAASPHPIAGHMAPQLRIPHHSPHPPLVAAARAWKTVWAESGEERPAASAAARRAQTCRGQTRAHTRPQGQRRGGAGGHPPRGPLLSPTHWSLQMQMTGLIRSPPSARRRRPPLVGTAGPPDSASCGPLRSRMLRRTLTAAWGMGGGHGEP